MFQVLTVAVTGLAAMTENIKCDIGKMFIYVRTFARSLNDMNYTFKTPRTKRQYFSNVFAPEEFTGLDIVWNNDNKCRGQLKDTYLTMQHKSMKFDDENKRILCSGMDSMLTHCNYTRSFW